MQCAPSCETHFHTGASCGLSPFLGRSTQAQRNHLRAIPAEFEANLARVREQVVEVKLHKSGVPGRYGANGSATGKLPRDVTSLGRGNRPQSVHPPCPCRWSTRREGRKRCIAVPLLSVQGSASQIGTNVSASNNFHRSGRTLPPLKPQPPPPPPPALHSAPAPKAPTHTATPQPASRSRCQTPPGSQPAASPHAQSHSPSAQA